MIKFCFIVGLILAVMSCTPGAKTSVSVHVEGTQAMGKAGVQTPDSLYAVANGCNTMIDMKIAIACDHAGYEFKEKLVAYLRKQGHEVKDFGTHSAESMDYPDTAHPMAIAVEAGEFDRGIALCGSGNGICMTVNKHQGIRGALCWTIEIAWLARLHNDANVCCIPARFIPYDEAQDIVERFLTTEFEGGRHQRRIEKIPVKK